MGSVEITPESMRQREEIIDTFTKLVVGVQENRTEDEFIAWVRGLSDGEFAATFGMMLVLADQWLPFFLLLRDEREPGALEREVASRQAEVRARSYNDNRGRQ